MIAGWKAPSCNYGNIVLGTMITIVHHPVNTGMGNFLTRSIFTLSHRHITVLYMNRATVLTRVVLRSLRPLEDRPIRDGCTLLADQWGRALAGVPAPIASTANESLADLKSQRSIHLSCVRRRNVSQVLREVFTRLLESERM